MATLHAENVETLNDLIRINNDRVDGYTKAIEELKNQSPELASLFQLCISTSKRNIAELTNDVIDFGGEAAQDNTSSGKIYHAWMDVKATFTGNDIVSIVSACEFGEDAAQRAYEMALKNREELSAELITEITQQKSRLRDEHDKIKAKRDSLKS